MSKDEITLKVLKKAIEKMKKNGIKGPYHIYSHDGDFEFNELPPGRIGKLLKRK